MDNSLLLKALSACGLLTLLMIACLLSEARGAISRRIVFSGIALQLLLAGAIMLTPIGIPFFNVLNSMFEVVNAASLEGARFLFGNLTDVFLIETASTPGPNGMEKVENFPIIAVVGFRILPTIIFVAGLAAVLEYLGITQRIIGALAWLMRRTMKTSGAETFSTALEVFMGIEGVSALGSYLRHMTRSEIFTVMTAYLSTIAGSVMVAYTNFGAQAGHLMAASIMGAPAAIVLAKIIVPEQGSPETQGLDLSVHESGAYNVFDAAARGASLGLRMALNVGAMLIVFIGSIHILEIVCSQVTGLSLTVMLGWVFRPVAFLLGVPWQDIPQVATLLATKSFFNEFIAYSKMQEMIQADSLTPRSITIATYALCGFANPGSLGIMIGALDVMMPERRREVAGLVTKAFIAGTFASFMTASIAGILLP